MPDFGATRKLSYYYNREKGDDIPPEIIGAEILAFGAPEGKDSGLVMVFKTKAGETKKWLLGFDETSMWFDEIISL